MRTASARWLAAFLALSGCATGFVSFPLGDEAVVTEDLNRDGQPDVWRVHDQHGRLTEIVRDSNFDGQPDVREYYDRGVLVRRESDRNFNNQIDLIEDFDAGTRQHVRSVVDLDDDGTGTCWCSFRGRMSPSSSARRATVLQPAIPQQKYLAWIRASGRW